MSLSPDVSLPSEATSCNLRSDARQGRTRSATGAWQVPGLMNGTTQVRAPLRGSARAGSRSQSPKGLARLTNAATPSMPLHSQANRALLRPSGVRTQGVVPTGTVPLALPCSGGKIAPACEVQFMRPDTTARDQADSSDNTASRACRFEVSAEQPQKDGLFLTKLHNPLSYIHLYLFSRNR